MNPLSLRYAPDVAAAKAGEIARAAVADSHLRRSPNFTAIAAGDLSRLFDLYDRAFFDGRVRRVRMLKKSQ
jgi:hypothetical protein